MGKRKSNPHHLYKPRDTDVWWIRYTAGGIRQRRSLHTTDVRKAERLRDLVLGKSAAVQVVKETFGIHTADDAAPVPTFGKVADRYLAHLERREAMGKLRSLHLFRGHLKNWILPEFAKRPISAITDDDVERFLAKVSRSKAKKGNKRLSQDAIVNIYRSLKRTFRYALRRRIFQGVNPCDLEDAPTNSKGRDTWLTPEEVASLLDELDGQMFYMVALAVHTGLRWGEICGLNWADVDLRSTPKTIRVKRSYQGPPKNATSMLPIELNSDAVSILRQWKAHCDSMWLFPSAIGSARKRMSGADRKALKAAAKRAGIAKDTTPHVLRHSFGTLLYLATHDAVRVQYALRHANVETTLRRYVHPNRSQGMTDVVNELPSMLPTGRVLKAV